MSLPDSSRGLFLLATCMHKDNVDLSLAKAAYAPQIQLGMRARLWGCKASRAKHANRREAVHGTDTR